MPLPRFTRLPVDEQQRIIAAARAAFAAEGVDRATYAGVIDAIGVSKSSAYNYFDGRDDLLGIVLDDVAARLRAALGPWERVSDQAAFWSELTEATGRLEAHAASHPDDLALVDPAFLLRMEGGFTGWVRDVIDNGAEIGLVTVICDRDLLVRATAAVLRAGDAWAVEQLRAGRAPDYDQTWALMRQLWGG
jgi:AcrR family transcriptional regulator